MTEKKEKLVHKFMRMTQKTQAIWGPADRIDYDYPATEEEEAIRKEEERAARKWVKQTDEDGQTYAVEKKAKHRKED